MTGRNLKKKICVILLSGAVICTVGSFPGMAVNSEIAASQQKISSNKEKIAALQQKESDLKNRVSELKNLKNDAAAYIEELDREQDELTESIISLEEDIKKTQEEITITENELEEATDLLRGQYASMKLRIRYMYESGNSDFLDSLLGAGSVADILNSVEYVQKVTAYDRAKLESFAEAKKAVEEKKEELSTELLLLNEQEAALNGEKAQVEELLAAKSSELQAYEAKIDAAKNEINAIEVDAAALQKAIKQEENNIAAIEAELRRKEEEAKKKAESEGRTYETKSIGNISFMWPVPSSGRVTSYFGSREAPVAGASTSHKGIDIGAGSGSDIKAAAGGSVVIATYSSSAGNYIMISHGGGVYTVYMHMKSMAVSEGDEVSKGQVIGYVGSTGYSTGPHLHFGIRVDGSYVDPLDYVSP
ncbi:MAG: peptidoglycan DD-metalloendopeptidase family protein [Lachnospiraceae bacterium]|nr:peptidoglycan DD-metalloendopeptidase family protein [Lachnospiraceae bacterium]